MNKPCIIIGGGGHASVLVDILLSQEREILAVVSPNAIRERLVFADIKQLNQDEEVFSYDASKVALINGVGPKVRSSLRKNIVSFFSQQGYKFERVVADSAIVSPFAKLDEGAQVLQGAILQNGSVIGAHSVINTGAKVDHDCKVGTFNHIAPNATLCGEVATQDNVYVGAGSTIIQCISVGKSTVIGAGAVVTRNIEENTTVFPARCSTKGEAW